MNALKAHYRYVAEKEAKEYEERRKKELERIKNMTPEEREEYEKNHPRVVHLSKHAKKARVRKKNINRIRRMK